MTAHHVEEVGAGGAEAVGGRGGGECHRQHDLQGIAAHRQVDHRARIGVAARALDHRRAADQDRGPGMVRRRGVAHIRPHQAQVPVVGQQAQGHRVGLDGRGQARGPLAQEFQGIAGLEGVQAQGLVQPAQAVVVDDVLQAQEPLQQFAQAVAEGAGPGQGVRHQGSVGAGGREIDHAQHAAGPHDGCADRVDDGAAVAALVAAVLDALGPAGAQHPTGDAGAGPHPGRVQGGVGQAVGEGHVELVGGLVQQHDRARAGAHGPHGQAQHPAQQGLPVQGLLDAAERAVDGGGLGFDGLVLGAPRRGGGDARDAVGRGAQPGQQGVGAHGRQAQVDRVVQQGGHRPGQRPVDQQVPGGVVQGLQVGDHRDAHDLGQLGAQAGPVGVGHGRDPGVTPGRELRQQGQFRL